MPPFASARSAAAQDSSAPRPIPAEIEHRADIARVHALHPTHNADEQKTDVCCHASAQPSALHQAPSQAPVAPPSTATNTSKPSKAEQQRHPQIPRYTYNAVRLLGQGAFGSVFLATVQETGEAVAVKKVAQDPRYKNREHRIMATMRHPNVVKLRCYFYSSDETTAHARHDMRNSTFLNLVMEVMPATLHGLLAAAACEGRMLPAMDVRLYAYQMLRALAYLHCQRICHRDIKPQNLLVDPQTKVLKLCDFGSAKVLVEGEPNVSYICSRHYRAPELIFGSATYDTSVDLWSAGCVLAEMCTGAPLFQGGNAVEMLVAIIRVLGTPTAEQVHAMNPNFGEFSVETVQPSSWPAVLNTGAMSAGVDMPYCLHTQAGIASVLSQLLVYDPAQRIGAFPALSLSFFDELRDPAAMLDDGRMAAHGHFPPLFNFSELERKFSTVTGVTVVGQRSLNVEDNK